MTDPGIVAVIIGPVDHPGEELIAGVAALLKKDLYATGLLLTGKTPKIVSHLPDIRSAEQFASELQKLGLTAFTVEERELHKPASYFKVNKIISEESSVGFEDRSRHSKRLEAAAVFLILKGKLFKRHETNVEMTSRKLNISSTLLTGIPMLKKQTKTVKEVSIETEAFLRIYERQSMDPAIELLQHGIDYSFLGPQMTYTSQGNFSILVKKLTEAFPGAIFNDSLMEAGKADLTTFAEVDISTVNSRLLYLYYAQLEGNKAP